MSKFGGTIVYHKEGIAMEEKQTTDEYQKLLNLALDLGHLLLENGAEIYRVEDTIQHVLYAYGAKHVDVFAVTNNITVTITLANDSCYTRLRRVYARTTNFQIVEALNELSREVCRTRPSADEFSRRIKEIRKIPRYSEPVMTAGFAGVAFCFTLMFGGTISDALVAMCAGAMVRVIVWLLDRLHTNGFFINLFASFMVTLTAVYAVKYGIAQHSDMITIGTLMTLVPGVAITNAMRDIIAGDLLAGTMKAVEALLVALALAIGTGIVLIMTGGM